jgi:hypothetical protein
MNYYMPGKAFPYTAESLLNDHTNVQVADGKVTRQVFEMVGAVLVRSETLPVLTPTQVAERPSYPTKQADGTWLLEWRVREMTTEELEAAASAKLEKYANECRRRILSVADETAQMNMASAAAAGLLSNEQQAAFVNALLWVSAMRGTWRGLAETDADLSDDANWPDLPVGVAELAAAF